MVLEVSQWDHHRGGKCPAETTGARVVIHTKEAFLSVAREQIGVSLQDWLDLHPLRFDLRCVEFGIHLQFRVLELIDFALRPIADKVSFVHHINVRLPEGGIAL